MTRTMANPRLRPPCCGLLRRGVVRERRLGTRWATWAWACLGVWATAAPAFGAEPTTPSASSPSETSSPTTTINARIAQAWREHGVRPAAEATEAEWCRRVYLDLIGRIPKLSELDAYVADRSRTRRAALVDRLLGPEYRAEYARYWTSIWTNLLIGRTGGTQNNALTSRAGMQQYLEACFRENRPYRLMVRELLTATGDARPDMENFQGATNFLIEKLDEGGVQATAKTSQLFLGMSVQCTQCHNHPFNDYRQNQFWELNAFFRQTRVRVAEGDDDDPTRYATLVDVDFGGEGLGGMNRRRFDDRREVFLEMRDGKLVDRDAADVYSAPIFYELRNGQVQTAYPVFVDGTSLVDRLATRGSAYGNSGALEHVNRRQELAELVLGSDALEKALVNRLWAHFFGWGFTKPIDDMGPHNPASHPELLDELAGAVRAAEFDLQALMRWIVLSEPYALSSRITRGNEADDPAQGQPPLFSRFYLRQMNAEQLYESLLAATEADAAVDAEDRDARKQRWLAQFATAFGNDEGTESTTFNGSIPQALTLMNGDLMERACSTDSGSFLDRVARNADLSERDKINYLYRAAVGRPPSNEERNVCNQLLTLRQGDVPQTLQDVWWAVLNSNEFILIH